MAFCPACGSSTNGQFCANCGAGSGGVAAQAAAAPPALSGNMVSMLCYFPLLALIFLLLAPYNKDKTVRFHALQCLGLVAVMVVLQIALTIVTAILASIVPALAGPVEIVFDLIALCGLALFIIGMVKAYRGQKLWLPVLSPLAEKYA